MLAKRRVGDKTWLCLLLLLLSAGLAAEQQIAYLESPPWLIDTAPQPTGILPDLTALLFVDVPVPKAVVVPTRRLRSDLAAGLPQWAYWPCQLVNPDYDSLGIVLQDAFGLAIRADAAIHQPSDLQGKAVGVWASRVGMLPELEQDPTINKHEFNSIDNALMMLKAGRLDAVVMGKTVFRWQTRPGSTLSGAFTYLQLVEVKHCLFAHHSVSAGDRETLSRRLREVVTLGQAAAVVERWLLQPAITQTP